MLKNVSLSCVALLVVALVAAPARAVSTETWVDDSAKAFQAGTCAGASITTRGHLVLSPRLESLSGISAQYVWAMARDSKGNVYLGTGDRGVIYKVTPKHKVSELYRTSEMHVTSVAVDAKDNVYAGTAPRGMIWRITPKTEVTVFYDATDSYIWAMAFDKKGALVVATGNKGRILRIAPDGKAATVYKSSQAHLVSMVLGPAGDIYAGSEPDGIVYRIKPGGAVSVLYDADEPEVHCLALARDGTLYAGTAASPVAGRGARSGATSTPAVSGTASSPGASGRRLTPGRPTAPKASAVYRIKPGSGLVQKIFTLPGKSVYSLVPRGKDMVYVGTGDAGKLFRIRPDGSAEMVVDRHEKQLLCLFAPPGPKGAPAPAIWIGTANNGGVHVLSSARGAKGTYTSRVHATSFVTRWGRISWDAEVPKGTLLALGTRTGNTSRPDGTWSPWSPDYAIASGQPIVSPPARFIQYRVRAETKDPAASPVFKRVTVAYLPPNLPPEVSSVQIRRAQAARKPGPGTRSPRRGPSPPSPSPRPAAPKGPRTMLQVSWAAKDPNNDGLRYTLHYKGVEETAWKELEDEVKAASHQWDTESVPDGEYQVKVIAADAPDNPPGTELTAEKASSVFVIDNTRPRIENAKCAVDAARKGTVTGVAVDERSPIQKVEYAVDAGEWIAIFPADSIFDSRREPLRFRIGPLAPGEHSIVVRVADAQGNVGCGKVIAHVK